MKSGWTSFNFIYFVFFVFGTQNNELLVYYNVNGFGIVPSYPQRCAPESPRHSDTCRPDFFRVPYATLNPATADTSTQECGCTITEVENNTVSPCTIAVGTIDTVSSVSEFKTAVNNANASGGDMTILIANGTYQVASSTSYPYITASNVVIRSLSGNRDSVILTGNGMVDVAPDTEIGIYAVGDSITITDLTIRDVGNHAIAVTGENLFVHNVRIQNTYEQMIKGNATNGGADNGKVQCSLFEYTAGVGPQWYIGGMDIHDGHNIMKVR